MQTEHSCRLCGSQSIEITYDGPMRHSGVGTERSEAHRILRCGSCFVEFIDPLPEEGNDVYRNGAYWSRKGGRSAGDIERLHAKALVENMLWLEMIGTAKLAGQRVLDYGCGSGAFLDLIKGVAGTTVGIELDPDLAAYAKVRGHKVYGSLAEAQAAGVQVDAVVSFGVFEHLCEPRAVLESIKTLLTEQGRLHVGVLTPTFRVPEGGPALTLGPRWFREAGGMAPISLAPHSGRYLSLVEREELALLRAEQLGVREIARRLDRSASTISRELRRNAETRGGTLKYRATVAQWKAERAAKRPKTAKLAENERLLAYV